VPPSWNVSLQLDPLEGGDYCWHAQTGGYDSNGSTYVSADDASSLAHGTYKDMPIRSFFARKNIYLRHHTSPQGGTASNADLDK